MKISVTVPIYNVEAYIERCARSLFEQTFDDIEYIFVDDCTPDASVSVLLGVLEDYPRRKDNVKIIRHEHNMGLPAARKTGLDASSGEYIYFCDSDDWLEKDALEKCFNIAETECVDMVCFRHICEKDGFTECSEELPEANMGAVSNLRNLLRPGSCIISAWGKLIRRRVFLDNDIKFAEYNMAEDLVMSFQLFYYIEKVYFLNEFLYHYNMKNQSSLMHLFDTERHFRKVGEGVKNFRLIEAFAKSKGLSDLRWEIDYAKYCFKRSSVYRYLPSLKYQWLFLTTFPELFFSVIANKCIPLIDRIKYYFTLLGLWPAPYKIVMKIRQYFRKTDSFHSTY